MLIVAVVFLIFSWTSFALRVYVRAILLRSFGWDDWTMLLTICLSTTCCSLLMCIERIENGDGPQRALEEGIRAQIDLLNYLMKYIISLMGLYILTTVALKISLAIFFLRIVVRQWQRRVIWITTAVYTIYATAFAFVAVFQCGIPTNFLIKEAVGICIKDDVLQPLNYIHASLNAVSDWTFAFLPVFLLWNSQMPRSAKISAGLLLSLGAVGSIISLVRIAYIPGLKTGPAFFTDAINIGVFSLIEPAIGLNAACLATLRPLFKNMVGKVRSNATNTTNSESSPSDNSKSSSRKPIYSGARFGERGYFQMDDDAKHHSNMGNFTSVVGDLKRGTQQNQVYELKQMTRQSRSMEGARVGSLQNKSWFPDDEVSMTRRVNVFDEEADDWVQPPIRLA
ncbi:hypothetical protein M436DRAFT_76522 [Aureobasidium namibiae CBS 147.97]|uniref:Rhodopsin domain-containing protein n=1 Tax=Aureobasidium namibiae CBS 147.97 TaxID=1043004 RepID=A0A074W778_9PEZI|nr:uncharacterized protein M436DRAFT_76522 [Aureobasidium namibiae CBS 147.97]KEQ68980.1 hypothetical protein M436DRAFT_76522 [Aureobasidium namibiae CBS 147.97]